MRIENPKDLIEKPKFGIKNPLSNQSNSYRKPNIQFSNPIKTPFHDQPNDPPAS